MSDWGIVVDFGAAVPAGAIRSRQAPAEAVLVDFAGEAERNGPRALANFSILRIGGVNVQLVSGDSAMTAMFQPCLAEGVGLGVRRTGRDDLLSRDTTVQVAFFNAALTAYRPLSIDRLAFVDARRRPLGAGRDGFVRIVTDKGTMTDSFSAFMARAARGDGFFADTRFVLFGFVDTPFYVSGVGVLDAPLSSALPLLAPNAAGLGFAARRKKNSV